MEITVTMKYAVKQVREFIFFLVCVFCLFCIFVYFFVLFMHSYLSTHDCWVLDKKTIQEFLLIRYLRMSSCLAFVQRVMDACRRIGERDNSVGFARDAAQSYSSFSSALQIF